MERELEKAVESLKAFAGEELDVVAVNSENREDAPFLAKVVSKLSPLIGNYMELKIAELLNAHASHGYGWKRQDPGFPDAVLKDTATGDILAGYEVKAWYVLSTEITGRFRESLNLLQGKNVNVVIVAWCMSNMIFGRPTVLGTLVVSGEEVARSRDIHYHNPPQYLCIEPNDTTARTANLQQSNVNGYRLQRDFITPEIQVELDGRTFIDADSHTPEKQAEALALMSELSYRLDTNFAKIDRIENPDIEEFKSTIMNSTFLGKTISQWKVLFADLNNTKNDAKRTKAEETIKGLYEQLVTTEVKTAVAEESSDAH